MLYDRYAVETFDPENYVNTDFRIGDLVYWTQTERLKSVEVGLVLDIDPEANRITLFWSSDNDIEGRPLDEHYLLKHK